MPATTAEKHARQCANKLLRIGAETTTVSDVQLPAATDKITSEPLTPPVLPCSYSKLNFLTSNVSSRQLGQVRKASILRYSGDVHCAFAEGKKARQEEEYNRGYAAGYNEGYSDACEKDYEAGLTASVSTTEMGTQTTIDAPTQTSLLHGDVSTQTSTISHLNASVQASEPPITATCNAGIQVQTLEPPLLDVLPQMTNSPPLNWADDADSLPIQIIPSPLPPHDFSVLRSSKSNPFSSLQHRSKRFTSPSHQSHCRHSHFYFNSFNSLHHNSFKPSFFHTKTHSHLNWESDPRLSDLSRSLRALGWIRAS